jgi:hypothetical protein
MLPWPIIKAGEFMKFILALFLSIPVYSNTFTLSETGARFTLVINPKEVTYKSEGLKKTIPLKKCNEALAQDLNKEFISRLPSSLPKTGFKFQVDKKELLIDPQTEWGKSLVMMDSRIMRLIIEEKEACK